MKTVCDAVVAHRDATTGVQVAEETRFAVDGIVVKTVVAEDPTEWNKHVLGASYDVEPDAAPVEAAPHVAVTKSETRATKFSERPESK